MNQNKNTDGLAIIARAAGRQTSTESDGMGSQAIGVAKLSKEASQRALNAVAMEEQSSQELVSKNLAALCGVMGRKEVV